MEGSRGSSGQLPWPALISFRAWVCWQGYYQESGRAGRDGQPAECVIMAAPKDYPRIIQLLRRGGRGGRAKFQAGMELLKEASRPSPAVTAGGCLDGAGPAAAEGLHRESIK